MVTYIVRRLVTAALILLGASFLVYLLTASSGDPLADLRASNAPNKQQLMDARTELLDLDTPAPVRYFKWLGGAAQCLIPFANSCDLGESVSGQPITEALGIALVQTLTLVTGATILAILIGITLGIVTALRQYSALDYGVTFMAFLFFSLPIFWVAVLLKEYGAIGFNDFLRNPEIPIPVALGIGAIAGLVVAVAVGGELRRRLITGGTVFAAVTVVLIYFSITQWFRNPGLGPVVIAIAGVGLAFAVTVLVAGLKNRRALQSSLIVVGIGVVAYFAVQPLLNQATALMIALLAVATVGVGIAVGYFMGGYDRGQSMRAAGITAFLVGGMVVMDRFMQAWPSYFSNSRVRGRPIATIGAGTPNIEGDFWVLGTDTFTHLILPTVALILVSLASYTRFTRSSMLEIMNMDYIRTARAKGLSERSVVMGHAFRNALIPIATIVAFDIGALIGGAVITESVFSVRGMGFLFLDGITHIDPNPVMGVFLCVAVTAMVFNLIADLAYSALDPRVRIKA
ncbi:peptide/nickel transport system permease protein [Arthrobacter ginsengisoli]|uniref:Peptide/nickel transport system permease protein n=1 Tax=Arthrobacter ginsengisoli TaxID=1356565 RepID=A0ABU1UAT9_9MICC|nr:ABC transporter permease [Arthrobacter ginsengisoli]MDR7082317.1 peptide/nickel transport system permease protein [Arthrobacter ginsengisoli]